VRVLLGNGPWMVWNTLLALIPLGFAVFLFVRPVRGPRSPFWWLGLAGFVAFLPNAPYVLTDLIHLRGDTIELRSSHTHTAVLYVEYALFVIIGVTCYVGSLELLRRFVLARGWSSRNAYALELSLHALCAVGVLLGRVARFNSWDLGSRPGQVFDHALSRLDRPMSWVLLLITFGILVVATFAARAVGLAFATVLRALGPPRSLS
jgi:uncharacterized membrane protein